MSTDSLERTTSTAGQASGLEAKYPGIPTTCDGAEAVVWVEKHISQGSGAYPITSSTTMGAGFNVAVANGETNLWGESAPVFRAGKRTLSRHFLRRLCRGRWAGHQLYVGPRLGLDERGTLHPVGQAIACRV